MKPTATTPETPTAPETPSRGGGLLAHMEEAFRKAGYNEDAPADEAPETPAAPAKPGAEEPPVKAEKPESKEPKVVKTPSVDDFTSIEESEEISDEEEEETVEDDADGDDEVPESVEKQGEKAVETWKNLKKETREAKTTAKELAAKVKDLERQLQGAATGETAKELEALRNRVAEQERIIAATSVVESEEYRTAVTEPARRIEHEVRDIVEDPEQVERIFDAMNKPTTKERIAALTSATEDMPELARQHVYNLSNQYLDVLAKDAEIREKAVAAKAEIDRNALARQNQETEQEKQARLAASDKVWNNTVKKMAFAVGDDGELLPEFAGVREKGRDVSITEATLGTQAFAPYAVQLVPVLVAKLNEAVTKQKELSAQVDRLTGATPKPKVASVSQGSAPGKRVPLAERLSRQIGELTGS